MTAAGQASEHATVTVAEQASEHATMTAAGQASENATMTAAGQAGEHATVTAAGETTATAAELEPATVAVGARQESAAATTASTGRGGTAAATDNAGQGARSGSEAPNTPSASGSGNKPPPENKPPVDGTPGEPAPNENTPLEGGHDAAETVKGAEGASRGVDESLASLKPPVIRHYADRVTQTSIAKEVNTVIDRSVTDVPTDVAAIKSGQAEKIGDTFVVNGRTYGMHDGRLYPMSGPGFYTLDRAAYKALGVLNKFGDTPQADRILSNMGISAETKAKAFKVYEVVKK
jgi:hypothetical protein